MSTGNNTGTKSNCRFKKNIHLLKFNSILFNQYERFSTSVYNIQWYLMSQPNKKMCFYILMVSQVNKPLTFWDYDQVNISTFLKVFFFFVTTHHFLIFNFSRFTIQFTPVLCYCTILVIIETHPKNSVLLKYQPLLAQSFPYKYYFNVKSSHGLLEKCIDNLIIRIFPLLNINPLRLKFYN